MSIERKDECETVLDLSDDSFEIILKTLNDKDYQLAVNPDDTAARIKQRVFTQYALTIDTILYKGNFFQENQDENLTTLGVKPGHFLVILESRVAEDECKADSEDMKYWSCIRCMYHENTEKRCVICVRSFSSLPLINFPLCSLFISHNHSLSTIPDA